MVGFYKRNIKRIALVFLIGLVAISCNRKAAVTNSNVSFEDAKAKDVVRIIDTMHIDFDELKARFKIKADLNGQSRSFNADLRWEKDEKMWMSFSIFGIEGVRALFTQDSVYIINKLQKQFYYGTYESLQQISQVPLSFEEIENLFLGKLTGIQDQRPEIRFDGSTAILDLSDNEYKASVKIDRKTMSIQHFLITSLLESRSVNVTLSDYQQIKNKNWPNNRIYRIKSGDKYLNIDAITQKLALNEAQEYPFYINSSYEKIPLERFR